MLVLVFLGYAVYIIMDTNITIYILHYMHIIHVIYITSLYTYP